MNHAAVVAGVAGDVGVVADALAKPAAKSVRPSAVKTDRKKHANRANPENNVNRVAAADPAARVAHGVKIRVAVHRKTISMMTALRKLSSTIPKMKPSTAG